MMVDLTNLMRFKDFLIDVEKQVIDKQEMAVMRGGLAYEADMKKSPLTPVEFGQYRGTIRADLQHGLQGPVSVIGSPMPQTRRLEFGYFNKTDRLGRTFHQQPRKHWRPVWDLNLAKYEKIMFDYLLKDVHM